MLHTKILPTIEDGGLPEAADAVHGELAVVGALPGGMASGKPAVVILVRLNDGSHVVVQTSLAMFQAINAAFVGRHGVMP